MKQNFSKSSVFSKEMEGGEDHTSRVSRVNGVEFILYTILIVGCTIAQVYSGEEYWASLTDGLGYITCFIVASVSPLGSLWRFLLLFWLGFETGAVFVTRQSPLLPTCITSGISDE
jgi:hypothetical protein